jgi:hypothetical protein
MANTMQTLDSLIAYHVLQENIRLPQDYLNALIAQWVNILVCQVKVRVLVVLLVNLLGILGHLVVLRVHLESMHWLVLINVAIVFLGNINQVQDKVCVLTVTLDIMQG